MTHITNVLGDIVSWKSLMKMKIICSDNKFHYKTIIWTHLVWERSGVYEKAFNEMRRIARYSGVTVDRYIDGTLIINCSGIESSGYGCGESRKKRLSSLSIVYLLVCLSIGFLYLSFGKCSCLVRFLVLLLSLTICPKC